MDDGEKKGPLPGRSAKSVIRRLGAELTKMRNVVLFLLVLQTTSIVLLMRYTQTVQRLPEEGPAYCASAAVMMAELLKLPVCLGMAAYGLGTSGGLRDLLREEVWGRRVDAPPCVVLRYS